MADRGTLVGTLQGVQVSFFVYPYPVLYSAYQLMRAMVYFDDAEQDVSPRMLKPVPWENVKRYFRREVKRIGSGLPGMSTSPSEGPDPSG